MRNKHWKTRGCILIASTANTSPKPLQPGNHCKLKRPQAPRRHWAPGQQDWKTASLHNAWLLAASDHWGMNQKCYDLNLRMQCTWRSLLGTICGLDQTYQILILTWIFWTLHTLSGRLWSSAWGKKRIPRVPVICCNFKCLSLLFEKAT